MTLNRDKKFCDYAIVFKTFFFFVDQTTNQASNLERLITTPR